MTRWRGTIPAHAITSKQVTLSSTQQFSPVWYALVEIRKHLERAYHPLESAVAQRIAASVPLPVVAAGGLPRPSRLARSW